MGVFITNKSLSFNLFDLKKTLLQYFVLSLIVSLLISLFSGIFAFDNSYFSFLIVFILLFLILCLSILFFHSLNEVKSIYFFSDSISFSTFGAQCFSLKKNEFQSAKIVFLSSEFSSDPFLVLTPVCGNLVKIPLHRKNSSFSKVSAALVRQFSIFLGFEITNETGISLLS